MSADTGQQLDRFKFVVITNQSGIARGYYSEKQYDIFQKNFCRYYKRFGIKFEGVYHCPHSPEMNCDCRKPLPKLVKTAIKNHKIDISHSVGVGDKLSDLTSFRSAGIRRCILIENQFSMQKPRFKVMASF